MANQNIRILGVDPGLKVTGYAVLETNPTRPTVCEAGIIRGSDSGKSGPVEKRLKKLYDGIAEVIGDYSPTVMVVEKLFSHYAHPRTAILMGHARGALLLAAAQHQMLVVNYNATRIKKTITGSGRASKDQMQRTMQQELGLAEVPEPADVADAMAAALCHYYEFRHTF